ncbi:30S ribosomal protein S7, partial [Mycoplasmopsis synoviae]
MSKKKCAKLREVLVDPIFNSVVVTKLINTIILDGKKSIPQDILYSAFDLVKEKTKMDPMQVFTQAFENINPQLEIRTRRIGGTKYQFPTEVS